MQGVEWKIGWREVEGSVRERREDVDGSAGRKCGR